MVHLVLTFCMLAWQTHCTEERPVLQDMSPAACMLQGQVVANEWLEDHPKWMLTRWRCEAAGARQVPS